MKRQHATYNHAAASAYQRRALIRNAVESVRRDAHARTVAALRQGATIGLGFAVFLIGWGMM